MQELISALDEAVKQPRQCSRCWNWFYDADDYPEGQYGTRFHGCDVIHQVALNAVKDRLEAKPGIFESWKKWIPTMIYALAFAAAIIAYHEKWLGKLFQP